MKVKEKIKKEILNLTEESEKILEFLQGKSKDEKFPFHLEYQQWYSKALKVVQTIASDRYTEFKSFYEIDPKRKKLGYGTYVIQDYIKGISPSSYSHPDFDSKNETLTNFYNQYTILISLIPRINSIIDDIEGTLLTNLQTNELDSAKELIKISPRASGALCGVIIEGHLKMVCDNHKITIRKKNPGISNLNELLKSGEIYETTTWRKISYLADIRNICSHKKDTEPTKEQVMELIEGANWLMKNVN
jgi:hypothetical protein